MKSDAYHSKGACLFFFFGFLLFEDFCDVDKEKYASDYYSYSESHVGSM